MRRFLLLAGLLALISGCMSNSTSSTPKATVPTKVAEAVDPDVRDNLAKLPPEDKKLAEAQRVCAVTEEPLGSMGVPIKLTLDGQPVFLCCGGCKKKAESDPAGSAKKAIALRTGAK